MPTATFNIREAPFNAVGDGYADDSDALIAALTAADATNGAIYLPAGDYLATRALSLGRVLTSRIAIFGDGANVSRIFARDTQGLLLSFDQVGFKQPYGATLRHFSVHALGICGTGLSVSYGSPAATNEHARQSTVISDVEVVSTGEGAWSQGIELESAWNACLHNVFVSGYDPGLVWNDLRGTGIRLSQSCVNARLTNVGLGFWKTGISALSHNGRNTEGLFIGNPTMVGVQRGIHLRGDATVTQAPRISTLTLVGGLIECRVQTVTDISTGVHLENIWSAMISSCQILSDYVPPDGSGKISYGVLPQDSQGIVVSGVDFGGWNYGVHTTGECRAINVHGCNFTNVKKQIVFPAGTRDSRSYGHVLVNEVPFEWTGGENNKLGFVS